MGKNVSKKNLKKLKDYFAKIEKENDVKQNNKQAKKSGNKS